jgi:hypothetical protein
VTAVLPNIVSSLVELCLLFSVVVLVDPSGMYAVYFQFPNPSRLYVRLASVPGSVIGVVTDPPPLASGGGSVTTPITLPGTDASRTYSLDGLGNWKYTAYIPEGSTSTTTENRRHNSTNELTMFGSTAVTYDHGSNAGNTEILNGTALNSAACSPERQPSAAESSHQWHVRRERSIAARRRRRAGMHRSGVVVATPSRESIEGRFATV